MYGNVHKQQVIERCSGASDWGFECRGYAQRCGRFSDGNSGLIAVRRQPKQREEKNQQVEARRLKFFHPLGIYTDSDNSDPTTIASASAVASAG